MDDYPFSFGGKFRPYDARDYHPDSIQTGSAEPTPEKYETPITTIYHQHHKPACGAHMLAGIINSLFGVVSSPKMAWAQIKLIDNLRPEDGTTLTAIAKTASNTGVCDLSLCPNTSDDTVTLTEYTNPQNVTFEMISNALPRKVSHYAFVDNPTFQQIKDNIFKFKVVGLLVNCGDGWWKGRNEVPSYKEENIMPLRLGTPVSGHFVYAYAFDERYVYFVNSWGTEWSRNGIGYFDENYVQHIFEMGTFAVGGKFIFTKDLMFGSSNSDVRELQLRLGVEPTGTFWLKTLSAVRKYQSDNGIRATGFVGPLTRACLNK